MCLFMSFFILQNLEAVFLRLCMTDVVNEEEEEEGPQFLNHVSISTPLLD